MEDRFLQQLKKGALEMLVLELICRKPAYGYELLSRLKEISDSYFSLKEGTLYPILYRLEDDGMICADWITSAERATPKKVYSATPKGRLENARRKQLWDDFSQTIEKIYERN